MELRSLSLSMELRSFQLLKRNILQVLVIMINKGLGWVLGRNTSLVSLGTLRLVSGTRGPVASQGRGKGNRWGFLRPFLLFALLRHP